MKCLFLEGRYVQKCTAAQGAYIPSSFELMEYCKSNRRRMCPLYLNVIRKPWAGEINRNEEASDENILQYYQEAELERL